MICGVVSSIFLDQYAAYVGFDTGEACCLFIWGVYASKLQAFVCWNASKLGFSNCGPVFLSSSACSLVQTTRYCLAGKAGTDSGAKASSQPPGEPVPDLLTPCLVATATRSVLACKQEHGVHGLQPVQIQALQEAERLPFIPETAQQRVLIEFRERGRKVTAHSWCCLYF